MNRATQRTLFIAGLSFASSLWAQDPAPMTPGPDTPPQTPTKVLAPTPRRERMASDDLSSALSAGIKYNPPPKPKPEDQKDDVDLRDVDKPRNGIIRLPKYMVEGERPPVFSNRNVYTSRGLADLAKRRYFSNFDRNFLNRYSIFGSNDERALQMYADEERLSNMADTNERIYLYRQSGDNAAANQLQNSANSTYIRRDEYSEPTRLSSPGGSK
jgi:hypothetical protein